MIFQARCQSFKIVLMMLVVVVSTLVANCQAERTPVSVDSQTLCQNLIGNSDVLHLKKAKLERQQDAQLWSDLREFAGEQVSTVKQTFAGLDLKSWWEQPSVRDFLRASEQQSNEADAISVTTMAVKLAANMTALQWWHAANVTKDLMKSGQQRLVQAGSKIEAEMRAGLLRLVELTASHVIQLANSPRVNGISRQQFTPATSKFEAELQSKLNRLVESAASNIVHLASSLQVNGMINAMATFKRSCVSAAPSITRASNDKNPVADPYWQYYTDCDFWGAQFDANKE